MRTKTLLSKSSIRDFFQFVPDLATRHVWLKTEKVSHGMLMDMSVEDPPERGVDLVGITQRSEASPRHQVLKAKF